MLFRDVVKLISVTVTENDMGDIIETPTEREVFADKQSIRQSEFYQAAATGLRPELMFAVRSIDYNQEPKLKQYLNEFPHHKKQDIQDFLHFQQNKHQYQPT